jgi:hypothetical protein
MNDLNRFTEFLKTVDLKSYREHYRPIKIVEMDIYEKLNKLRAGKNGNRA